MKKNKHWGKEELGQGRGGKQENAWKARCTTQHKSATLKYELWQESHETSSASSATSSVCPMGLQLEHWIRILPQSTTLPFPQKLLSTFHLRGNPTAESGRELRWALGISLTTVPHGPGATDSRIHEVEEVEQLRSKSQQFLLTISSLQTSRGFFPPKQRLLYPLASQLYPIRSQPPETVMLFFQVYIAV